MFKRISELFKPRNPQSQKTGMPVNELPGWLDKEEQFCVSRRSEYISRSRDAIEEARNDIRNLLCDFGGEETDEPLHPKVEQVNRHNLPQFKRKIEAALNQQLSDDDETYYRQVAEMVDGCFKAYQGPGRYLHILYGDEVKLFRQSMDQIGKELNRLTEIIKTSRLRLGRIDAVRSALERYNHAEHETSSITHQQNDLNNKREELVSEQNRLIIERDQLSDGPDIREYTNRIQIHKEEEQKVDELHEALDSLVRTGLPVWRKALRVVQDERDREKEKLMDQIIQLAVLQNYDDPAFLLTVQSTAPLLFGYITEETVPLKNSFEKALFCDSVSYVDQLTGTVNAWQEAEQHWKQEQTLLASHPAAARLTSFENRILEVIRDIRHIDEEIGKNRGKAHYLTREKDEAVKIIIDEMRELSGGNVLIDGMEIPTPGET